jgi:hypothetical protein
MANPSPFFVCAIGTKQGDAEDYNISQNERDYDIVCMAKVGNRSAAEPSYFLGLVRLSDPYGFKRKCEERARIRNDGSRVEKDCVLRISGGLDNSHDSFLNALTRCHFDLLQDFQTRKVPLSENEIEMGRWMSFAGSYLGINGEFWIHGENDYDLSWKFPPAGASFPQFEHKIGILLSCSAPDGLNMAQHNAFEILWQGFKKEVRANRGLILDWGKLSVNQAITAEDEIRGNNLHEFARLTHYLDGAIIRKPISKIFPSDKGKTVREPQRRELEW